MLRTLARLEESLGRIQYQTMHRAIRNVAGLRTGEVQAGPWRVPYVTGGKGPGLLLVHGFGDRKETWLPLMARLHKRFKLFAPDLLGFGASPAVDSRHIHPREQARTLIDLITSLDLGPMHVVGQSMGGAIAAYIALTYPEHCASVTLIAPAGPKGLAPEFEAHIQVHGNPLLVRGLTDFDRLLALSMAKRPPYPRTLRRHLARQWSSRRTELERHWHLLRNLSEEDLRPDLAPDLPPRSLVIIGDRERVVHPDNAEAYGQWLHHLRVETLPGIGHNPHHEATSRVASLICDHARR